jgi:hypothetical protein
MAQEPFPGTIRVLPMGEALEAAGEQGLGLSLWSDGSRSDNGRVGAWQAREVPVGLGKEMFDAKLIGAYKAPEPTLKLKGRGPVTVLLDS